jgi:4-amino-4-deoxy-L-arabinose transferase-like glycosyltransferase
MWKKEALVVTLLFVWGFLLRLPSFFPATINWDESTFIIIGQGILDRLLPYDAVWENKPPLVFVFFAAAIAFFGKTIFAVRFAGYLWVTAAAYLTYRAAFSLTCERIASLSAALLSLTATSLISPGVMSECIALVPLVGTLVLLLRTELKPASCVFAGLLMGTAIMLRTNLVYLAALLAFYIVLIPPTLSPRVMAARGSAYAAGVITVVLLTAIPYLIQGRFQLWFNSVFFIPLHYSRTLRSMQNAQQLIAESFGISPYAPFNLPMFLVSSLLWAGALLGICSCFWWREFAPSYRRKMSVLATFLLGSAISVFLTGQPYKHYLIQLVPWQAILLAVAMTRKLMDYRFAQPAVALSTIAMLVAAVIFAFPGYLGLFQRIEAGQDLAYGPEYSVYAFLKKEDADKQSVFLLSDIIVYWFLGQYPPTRLSAHPSNIGKQNLVALVEGREATCEGEMLRILASRPAFIVKTKSTWYLDPDSEVTRLLDSAIASDYVLASVIANREIYRRKD